MDKIPFTAAELIKKLDEMYPERCPSPTDMDREIWMYAGTRELVRRLVWRMQEEQEEGGRDVFAQ